ncbi:MAG: hypothetical protein GY861_29195, partial [bacterium]|nr:hypothetical protein [bacterium]
SENDANVTGSFTTNATDTTAPIVINSGPLGTDSDGNVTLIVTTDENATCKYSTVDSSYATMPNTFTTTGTTAHSEAINGLAEGVHQYYVRCTDGVNVMTTSAIIQFTVDLPGGDSIPPVITSITLDQPSYRRTQDPLVNMTIVTDVTAVNVTVNNVSATSLGGGLWFYSFAHPTVEGTYSIFVAAIDASNNTNEKEISYSVVANDTVVVPPPVIYFIDLDKPSYEVTNDPNVTITIGEDNNASFIIVEGVVLPGGLEVAPGVWNYTFAHGMTVPGTYSVLVQAIGATGSTVSYMVTYNVVADSPADTTPPAISSVMLDQPEYEMTNDPNVTVTIDEDNTAAFVWVNGALATEAGNTSIWSYTFAHGQASIGTYSVLVQVMDGAGNSATYMISYNVVADAVDTTSPYIIASTPTTMQQNNFQITVTLHDDGAAEAAGVCRYNQGSAFNFRANGGTLMGNLGGGLYQGVISNFTLDGTDDGRYSYYVVCNDSSGNVMVASYYMSVTFDTDGNFNYTQLLETEWSALLLPNPTVILNNWSINDTTLTTLLDNSGLNGDYDTVWYYDVDRSAGNEWISYTTGPAFDDLTTWVNDNNNPYWVHLTTIPSRFQVN